MNTLLHKDLTRIRGDWARQSVRLAVSSGYRGLPTRDTEDLIQAMQLFLGQNLADNAYTDRDGIVQGLQWLDSVAPARGRIDEYTAGRFIDRLADTFEDAQDTQGKGVLRATLAITWSGFYNQSLQALKQNRGGIDQT